MKENALNTFYLSHKFMILHFIKNNFICPCIKDNPQLSDSFKLTDTVVTFTSINLREYNVVMGFLTQGMIKMVSVNMPVS